MCNTQLRFQKFQVKVAFYATLLALLAVNGARGGVETLPQDVVTGSVAAVEAPTGGVAFAVSDISVAESALRDGLFGMAKSRAESVLDTAEMDSEMRDRAFVVLMSVYERTLEPEAWLKIFEDRVSDGVKWPEGDEAFARLSAYWKARALIWASQNDAAIGVLSQVLAMTDAEDVLHVPVLRLLAYALAVSGRAAEAIDLLGTEMNPTPEVIMDRARLFLQAGEAVAAASLLEPLAAFTNQVETSAMASLLRARALGDGGLRTNALTVLAELAAGPSTLPADTRALAMSAAAVLLSKDKIDAQSVPMAEKAVSIAESPVIRQECEMTLALILARCGLSDKAAASTRRLIAAAPRSAAVAETVRLVADQLLAVNMLQPALDEYNLFLSSFSGSPFENTAQRGRGIALSRIGQHAEAAIAYLKAAELSKEVSDKVSNLFSAAEAQRKAGFYRQAIATLVSLRGLSPSGPVVVAARLLEAECMAELDPQAAYSALIRLTEEFPSTSEAYTAFFLAARLKVLEDAKASTPEGQARAVELYQFATESPDPELKASSLLGIGLVKFHGGEYQDSLTNFELAVAVFGGGEACDQARLMGAEALLMLRRAEEAVAAVRAMLNEASNSKWYREALFWMARRSFNTSDYAQAEQHFGRYADTWPNETKTDNALLFKAQAQFQQKHFQESIDTVLKLINEYPESSSVVLAQFLHAEALTELLQFDAAILLYDVVIQTATDDPLRASAMARRGDCLFTLGADNAVRYAESIAAYEAVLASPTRQAFEILLQCEYKIGRSLDKAGRSKEASERYYANVICRFEQSDSALQVAVDSPTRVWYSRAVFGAAEIFERSEDWVAAVAMLERITKTGFPGAEEAARRIERMKKDRLDPATKIKNY